MKYVLSLLLIFVMLAGCDRNAQGSSLSAGGQKNDTQTQTQALMDAQALRAIAYEHAGVAEADVYDVDQEWKTLPDKTVYKLDFDAKGVEYEYGLNGYTGAIIYSTSEGTPEETTEPPEQLSEDEAKRIALEHAGLTEDQVTGLRVERDWDDRDYEIEFRADGYEYDYEIDIYTGDILKSEKDRD